jgi:hypothetical protein
MAPLLRGSHRRGRRLRLAEYFSKIFIVNVGTTFYALVQHDMPVSRLPRSTRVSHRLEDV